MEKIQSTPLQNYTLPQMSKLGQSGKNNSTGSNTPNQAFDSSKLDADWRGQGAAAKHGTASMSKLPGEDELRKGPMIKEATDTISQFANSEGGVDQLMGSVFGENVINELTAFQLNALRMEMEQLLESIVTPGSQPRVILTDNGSVETSSQQFLLPEGVRGAYHKDPVTGEGIILLSSDVTSQDPQQVNELVVEEFGEALVQDLVDGGALDALDIPVPTGDAGARISKTVSGGEVTAKDFAPNASDTALAKVNGQVVQVKAMSLDIDIADGGVPDIGDIDIEPADPNSNFETGHDNHDFLTHGGGDAEAYNYLTSWVDEFSTDDNFLTQSEVFGLMQEVAPESFSNNLGRNMILMYGDGTKISKEAIVETMTSDGLLVPRSTLYSDDDDSSLWEIVWPNANGTSIGTGMFNFTGNPPSDENSVITVDQFVDTFFELFGDDVEILGSSGFTKGQFESFLREDVYKDFSSVVDGGSGAAPRDLFYLSDVANIFDSGTLAVGKSSGDSSYIVQVSTKHTDSSSPVLSALDQWDSNGDGTLTNVDLAGNTNLSTDEIALLGKMYGQGIFTGDSSNVNMVWSRYQLKSAFEDGVLGIEFGANGAYQSASFNPLAIPTDHMVDRIFEVQSKNPSKDNLTADEFSKGLASVWNYTGIEPQDYNYMANVFGRIDPATGDNVLNRDEIKDIFESGQITIDEQPLTSAGQHASGIQFTPTDQTGIAYHNSHFWDTGVSVAKDFASGIGNYIQALTKAFHSVQDDPVSKYIDENAVAYFMNGTLDTSDLIKDAANGTAPSLEELSAFFGGSIIELIASGNKDFLDAVTGMMDYKIEGMLASGMSGAQLADLVAMHDQAKTGDAIALQAILNVVQMPAEVAEAAVLRAWEQGVFHDGIADLDYSELVAGIPEITTAYQEGVDIQAAMISDLTSDGVMSWVDVIAAVGGDEADASRRLQEEDLSVDDDGNVVDSTGALASEAVQQSFYGKHMRIELVAASEIDVDFLPGLGDHTFAQFKPYITLSMPRVNSDGDYEIGLKFGFKQTEGLIGVSENKFVGKTGLGVSNDFVMSWTYPTLTKTPSGPPSKVIWKTGLTYMALGHAKTQTVINHLSETAGNIFGSISGAVTDFTSNFGAAGAAQVGPSAGVVEMADLPAIMGEVASAPTPAGPASIFDGDQAFNLQAGVGVGTTIQYDLLKTNHPWSPLLSSSIAGAAGATLGVAHTAGLGGTSPAAAMAASNLGSMATGFGSQLILAQVLNDQVPGSAEFRSGGYGWALAQLSTSKGRWVDNPTTVMGKVSAQITAFTTASVADVG